MKKLLVILSMVLVSTSLMATIDEGDFIKTNNGTFFFQKVKNTITSDFIGVKSNGERVKFKSSEVLAFCRNGEIFEKMPVYKNNVLIGEEDFMMVVCYRNGMKLYEYEYKSNNTGKLSRRYYVFKGDKFVVEMDYVNRETLTAFFDAK